MPNYLDKNLPTLAISHHLHLTRDERYRVFDGEIVECVGISVPVWHFQGKTTEPAKEIFCKYILTNWADTEEGIRQNQAGYEINLPQPPSNPAPNARLTDEQWRNLTVGLKEIYYDSLKFPVTAHNLLDVKDGGSATLSFNQYSQLRLEQLLGNAIHFVIIEDIEIINSSIF